MGNAARRMIFPRFGLAAAVWLGLIGTAFADAPRVVASIAPVHSLVANVMAGVGEPRLLIRGFGSPHGYQLRPSEAADLARADVVFWIGDGLESVLARPLSALPDRARMVALSEFPGMVIWPTRAAGAWTNAGQPAADDHGHDDHGGRDLHLWLAPGNASEIVRIAAETLSDIDPANAPTYRANAERTLGLISAMATSIDRRLAPIRGVPFVVMHDAFQYFERHFALNAVGAVSVSPDRPPSARRLRDIRARIRQHKAVCAFSEPQMQSSLIETITEGTAMKRDVLDALGAGIPPGPDAYFEMMSANAAALLRCLAAPD